MIARTEHVLELPNLPPDWEGRRIVHLTDLHRSWRTSDALLRRAVQIANAADPDLIVLTGDYVTDDPRDIAPCGAILSELKAREGIYAILGNHDYGTDGPAMECALMRAGCTVLTNRSVRLKGGFWLVGIDDEILGRADISAAFEEVPADAYPLVLIHNPALAERFSERACTALAGHTHGGQVILPFVTTWKVRKIRAKHYRRGWFTVGKTRLYVNRGVGNVGVSFRFLTSPEVAVFTLKAR
jgi:predicted MPP superfamily phosphohydrolase